MNGNFTGSTVERHGIRQKEQVDLRQERQGGKKRNESGMIVVETVISFTVFLVTIFSIAYFINMLILHNKVQFAINSAAHELASYTYLYAAFGGRDASQAIKNDNADNTAMIDNTVSSAYNSYQKVIEAKGSVQEAAGEALGILNSFGDSSGADEEDSVDIGQLQQQMEKLGDSTVQAGQAVEGAVTQVKDTVTQVKGMMQNKEGVISGLAFIALEGADYAVKDLLGTGAAWLMTGRYLKQGDLDADAFLKSSGVVDGYGGLDFSGSSVFNDSDSRMIDIVVEYDVDPGFVRLILPEDVKLHMVNRVTIPAWLDGDGVKVEPGK